MTEHVFYNTLKRFLLILGVYIKTYSANITKDEPLVTISSLRFKMHVKDAHGNSELVTQEADTSKITRISPENDDFFQEAHYGESKKSSGCRYREHF